MPDFTYSRMRESLMEWVRSLRQEDEPDTAQEDDAAEETEDDLPEETEEQEADPSPAEESGEEEDELTCEVAEIRTTARLKNFRDGLIDADRFEELEGRRPKDASRYEEVVGGIGITGPGWGELNADRERHVLDEEATERHGAYMNRYLWGASDHIHMADYLRVTGDILENEEPDDEDQAH